MENEAMITYVGRKANPIDFNGDRIENLPAKPEETRAIVIKDNGKFAIAHYSYQRFGVGSHWVIWTDEEYSSQFKAMMAIEAVRFVKYLGKWVISDDNLKYA
jgi:hypothetical protein